MRRGRMLRGVVFAVVSVTAVAGCASGGAGAGSTAGSDPACVVGAWEADDATLSSLLEQVPGVGNIPGSVTVDGSSVVTFVDDGTYTFETDVTVSTTVAGVTAELRTAGGQGGGWTAADGALSVTAQTGTVSTSATVHGQDVSVDTTAAVPLPTTPTPFTCDDTTLVITPADTSGVTVPGVDVPQVQATFRRV